MNDFAVKVGAVANPRFVRVTLTAEAQQAVHDEIDRAREELADRQEAIFGFRDVTTVYNIDEDGKYGYAFYNPKKEEWSCICGSFSWVRGYHIGITSLDDDDSDGEEDETTSIRCWAFFRLDDDLQITHIIPHAQLSMDQTNRMYATDGHHSSTLRDLFSVSQTNTPPQLVWKA